MRSIPIQCVDAFTTVPFAGNPAAVCLTATARPDDWYQSVAAEMNLSETAFVHPTSNGRWKLRWFTPEIEVPLCGHATLASTHVLMDSGRVPQGGEVIFETRSGELRCGGKSGEIWMDFPELARESVNVPDGLPDALGTGVRGTFRVGDDVIADLESAEDVMALKPDFAKILRLGFRAVMVTAAGGPGSDFVSRFFAPAAGIPEDSVTGSAHCSLGPLWARRLVKTRLTGWQASRRGGRVVVEVLGNGRVRLEGQAITVWKGELMSQ